MSRVILCNEPLKIVKGNASNIYPGETSFASRPLIAACHSCQFQDIIRKRWAVTVVPRAVFKKLRIRHCPRKFLIILRNLTRCLYSKLLCYLIFGTTLNIHIYN